MGHLPVSIYTGELLDQACAVIMPKAAVDFPAIWTFCSSKEFSRAVRKIDQKLNVTNSTLVKVPFDLDTWRRLAAEAGVTGLPTARVSDQRNWLFDGQPAASSLPLSTGLLRLVGYTYPRQDGSSFIGFPAIDGDELGLHPDSEGIVCLAALQGKSPAEQRLIALLAEAFGAEWSAGRLAGLLAEAGFAGKTLDDWLRDGFFEQHCALFHQRPFVWHIWDGRRDGFHALVNYHRLAAPDGAGKRTLEKLIYSYLGDWITLQRNQQRAGQEGADARLAHAEHLRAELERILEGEPPYDIFVRWKPLAAQPIGWNPDINDGVRLNIRPFMTARTLANRSRAACILRTTPKIKWDKDRGKEPKRAKEDYPWFWTWPPEDPAATTDFSGGASFDGNRWNNLHYTCALKQAARERRGE
jgi:hypothetical protein